MTTHEDVIQQWTDTIDQFPTTARDAIAATEDTAELVDMLAVLHSTIGRLNQRKSKSAAELENGDAGRNYRFKRGKNGNRTYNMLALITKFQQVWKLRSAGLTIMRLVEEDVVRLSWQWKKLEAICEEYGVPLRTITGQPIENGDPDYDVGTVWKPATPSYEQVKE